MLNSDQSCIISVFGLKYDDMENTLLKSDLAKNKSKRDRLGRLVHGHGMGRPKGSLSAAAMLRDRLIQTVKKLDKDPRYDGDYILHFANEYPEKFMALVASLLPKQLKIETDHVHRHIAVMDLPERERAAVFAECRARVLRIRGVEEVEREDVKVLNEGKP